MSDADRFRSPAARGTTDAAATPHAVGWQPLPEQPQAPFGGSDAPLIHPGAAHASSQTPYGVPVYHAPAYGYGVEPSRGLSITAFVLGLVSVVVGWTMVVVPIIGLVFGFIALRREPHGRTLSVIGLVGSALGMLLVLLLYLVPALALLGIFLSQLPVS